MALLAYFVISCLNSIIPRGDGPTGTPLKIGMGQTRHPTDLNPRLYAKRDEDINRGVVTWELGVLNMQRWRIVNLMVSRNPNENGKGYS